MAVLNAAVLAQNEGQRLSIQDGDQCRRVYIKGGLMRSASGRLSYVVIRPLEGDGD